MGRYAYCTDICPTGACQSGGNVESPAITGTHMPDAIKKLLIKAGHRVVILPSETIPMPSLGDLPGGATAMESPHGTGDVVLLFVESRADQESRQGDAVERTQPGGLLWICYPKKTSGVKTDLSRDVVWQTMQSTGWRPVTQIAIDDVWSALRMRPEEDVKSSKSGE